MTVGQQETDIVDRSPDERCHIAVLRAAENSGIIQVEPVITNIDLPSAPSAFAHRIANLYTLENAAFIFAMIVRSEELHVGKECVRLCSYWWPREQYKKQ